MYVVLACLDVREWTGRNRRSEGKGGTVAVVSNFGEDRNFNFSPQFNEALVFLPILVEYFYFPSFLYRSSLVVPILPRFLCRKLQKREIDPDFSINDDVSDVTVKAGSTETIEIPAPKAGSTLVWVLIVIGWEVNYKEEFVLMCN
ncbi:unnamed protein product [Coffea canephora]|uniref:Patellin-1-6 C-terminal GOLD domain-containing protein n=1 Tax=Coffea canephora TaxID=49390 RepID=A0A068VEG2_COFCA|nr:unnamed protein product [Coffea canephora]